MQVTRPVGFYGHVRQYENIQSEIDANLKRVIESGEYVQGPSTRINTSPAVVAGLRRSLRFRQLTSRQPLGPICRMIDDARDDR
jgi:hypothetical protein